MSFRSVTPGTDELIADLYGMAAGITEYTAAADRFMALMKSSALIVHVHDESSSRNNQVMSLGVSDEHIWQYHEYYGARNFIHDRAVPIMLRYGYGQARQVAEDREVLASQYHNEWQRPVGIFHSCGCLLQARNDQVYSVLLGRARNHGAWNDAEMNTLGAVRHHLRSALEIRSHFHTLEAMHCAMDTAVESLDEAVFILGRDNRVLHANGTGLALLGRGEPISKPGGRLRGTGRHNARRLAEALKQARGPRVSAATTLDQEGLCYATTVISAQNTPSLLDLGSEADLIVFVHDPAHPAPSVRHLQLVFELTAREAEVVILLAQGLGPKAIARSLRLGVETVRSHVKRAMLKTGAHSQADLVSRVLRSVQPIRASDIGDER